MRLNCTHWTQLDTETSYRLWNRQVCHSDILTLVPPHVNPSVTLFAWMIKKSIDYWLADTVHGSYFQWKKHIMISSSPTTFYRQHQKKRRVSHIILPSGAETRICGETKSLPWMLIAWLLASLFHQQPWRCLCRMNGTLLSWDKFSTDLIISFWRIGGRRILCFFWTFQHIRG